MTQPADSEVFDPACRKCSRLSAYLDSVRLERPEYYCKPVPPFGDAAARLIIVGLAPGKHGANATGRPFTGDYAGKLLYQTLFHYGYASKSESLNADDGLVLTGCRITNAVKCLPPENKPSNQEINTCNVFLKSELDRCAAGSVILALGVIAHKAVLKTFGLVQARFPFGHEHVHTLDNGYRLLNSYHCSRYNTQTGRLTEAMFYRVFDKAGALLA